MEFSVRFPVTDNSLCLPYSTSGFISGSFSARNVGLWLKLCRPTTMYPAAPEKNNLWYSSPWVLNYILMHAHAHLVQVPLRKLYK